MNKENFKISAIIKTFNSEKTICEVLEAIKDSAEIIVLDTHSTDDTIEIAQEYKAKIIYADKQELGLNLNYAIEEAHNDWVLILEDDETVPKKLLSELEKYIQNPKKNKYCVTLSKKTFFLNREIKAARKKEELKFFKKGYAQLNNDFSASLKNTSGKIFKLNKNFRIKNAYILKYSRNDIYKIVSSSLEKCKNIAKVNKEKKPSIFFAPMFCFIYWYFIKQAFLDGRLGFIFAIEKSLEKYIVEVMILEKKLRGSYDF